MHFGKGWQMHLLVGGLRGGGTGPLALIAGISKS